MCGCKKHLDESKQCTCICDEHANFEAARDLAMRRFDAIRGLEAELNAALNTIDKIREAVSGHPKCDQYEDDDAITCGWKSAYASVVWALGEENANA